MFSKILVAIDGSPGASKALNAAIELSRRLHATLHMVCVEELPRFPVTIDEVIEESTAAQKVFDDVTLTARKQAKAAHVKLELPGMPFPASSNLWNANALTFSSSASWDTPRSTTA